METAQTQTPEDARKQRGAELAKRIRITRKAPGFYVVPASSGPGSYIVEPDKGSCSCPDHELRGIRCKHQWAVEYSRRTETNVDGTTKTVETLRITYSQEWSAYNAAQTHEKEHVACLLRDLCNGIREEPQTNGRPRFPMSDRVFAVAMKVYGGMSTRRSDTDMRDLAARGLMSKAPSYNSVIDYMDDPAMTPILRAILKESAAPLAAVETQIAIDSTGFTTCTYQRWFDEKYGKEHSRAHWIKAHAAVGPRTNIIADAIMTQENEHDHDYLPPLLAGAREHFAPQDVLADLGYLSRQNQTFIAQTGATPFIPFKVNSVAHSDKRGPGRPTELWTKLFHYFHFQREAFLSHYSQRSNVESTFSAVKRKFGAALKSKTFTAQVNEAYAKLICYNLSVLVHETYELGIAPMFWKDAPASDGVPADAKVIPLHPAREVPSLPENPGRS